MLYKFCTQHLIFHSGSLFPQNATQIARRPFAARRQWIQTLLSAAGVAIEDKIDRKSLGIWQFSLRVRSSLLSSDCRLLPSRVRNSLLDLFQWVTRRGEGRTEWRWSRRRAGCRWQQHGGGTSPLALPRGLHGENPPPLAKLIQPRLSRGMKARKRGEEQIDHFERIMRCLEYVYR